MSRSFRQRNALDFARTLIEDPHRERKRSRITALRGLCAAVVVLFALLPCGYASDLSGGTFVRLSGDGIGPPIANAALSFVREDGSAVFATASGATGRYAISLAPGRYYVLAGHPDYEDYNSAPGFAVVHANIHGTANFFPTTAADHNSADRASWREAGPQL